MFSNGKFSTCYLEERSGSKTKTNHLFWGGQMNFGVFFLIPWFFLIPSIVFFDPMGCFFWSHGEFFFAPPLWDRGKPRGLKKKPCRKSGFWGVFFCGGQLCFFEIGLVCCTIVLLLGLLLGLTFSWVFAIWLGIFWEGFHPRIWRDFGVFFWSPVVFFLIPCGVLFLITHSVFLTPCTVFLIRMGCFLIPWAAFFGPMGCFFDPMGCLFWSHALFFWFYGVFFLIPRSVFLIPRQFFWSHGVLIFATPALKRRGFYLGDFLKHVTMPVFLLRGLGFRAFVF